MSATTLLEQLKDRLDAARQNPAHAGKQLAVLLSTGALCPVHKQHLKLFDIAARRLRAASIEPILALLSPSCDSYVAGKLGEEAIPFVDRLEMCRLAAEEHKSSSSSRDSVPVAVDSWEGSQRGFVDFPEVREHLSRVVEDAFGEPRLRVFYVCGIDHFAKCGLQYWRDVVAVARPPFASSGAREDAARNVFIAEDPDAADLSSSEMRRRRAAKQSVNGITFDSVAAYLHDPLHWI